MAMDSYIDDEIQDILDFVRNRLRSGPCDSQTLVRELAFIFGEHVNQEFLDGLLWAAGLDGEKTNIDFDPCKSTGANMVWEYYDG